MKKIRLFSFLLFFLAVEVCLLGLTAWQHGRMLEKLAITQVQQSQNTLEIVPISGAKVGNVVEVTAHLEPDNAVFILHQKHKGVAGWRYILPTQIAGKKLWLDLGWLPPQRDSLTPDFSDYTQKIYRGTAVLLEVPTQKGWLKSPLHTVNERVWNRLDREVMGTVYLSAQMPLYRTISTSLPHGLSAQKHKQYRNTWAILAFILLFFCGFFLKSLKSKNN